MQVFINNVMCLVVLENMEYASMIVSHLQLFLVEANDSDEGPGRGQEQHEANEQEHHTERFKPSCSCGPVCPWLLLSSVPCVQILPEMKYQLFVPD